MRQRLLLVVVATSIGVCSRVQATEFTAILNGEQQVSPVDTMASGTAELTLSPGEDRLEIFMTIVGLDLDGLQTPGNPNDDVTNAHIHAAPAGTNGGIVFGFIAPNHDTNGDLVIDPVAGTIFSAWDMDEGNGTTLTDQLPNLMNEGLYINFHTVAHGGGEIRGQIVPEPSSIALLGIGLAGFALVLWRRKS